MAKAKFNSEEALKSTYKDNLPSGFSSEGQ